MKSFEVPISERDIVGLKSGVVLDPAKVQVARKKGDRQHREARGGGVDEDERVQAGRPREGRLGRGQQGRHRPLPHRGEAGALLPEGRRQPVDPSAAHLPPLAQYRGLNRADLLRQRGGAVHLGHFGGVLPCDDGRAGLRASSS